MGYQAFIVSNFNPTPAHHLHGQAFSGVDLVMGNEGYADYRRDRGRTIEPGEDGSYIVVGKSGSETVIGTDFAGYRKMFLYRQTQAQDGLDQIFQRISPERRNGSWILYAELRAQ